MARRSMRFTPGVLFLYLVRQLMQFFVCFLPRLSDVNNLSCSSMVLDSAPHEGQRCNGFIVTTSSLYGSSSHDKLSVSGLSNDSSILMISASIHTGFCLREARARRGMTPTSVFYDPSINPQKQTKRPENIIGIQQRCLMPVTSNTSNRV